LQTPPPTVGMSAKVPLLETVFALFLHVPSIFSDADLSKTLLAITPNVFLLILIPTLGILSDRGPTEFVGWALSKYTSRSRPMSHFVYLGIS